MEFKHRKAKSTSSKYDGNKKNYSKIINWYGTYSPGRLNYEDAFSTKMMFSIAVASKKSYFQTYYFQQSYFQTALPSN